MLKKFLYAIAIFICIEIIYNSYKYISENNMTLSTMLFSPKKDSNSIDSAKGLRELIKSTSWSFEGFGTNIRFEFDSDSTFKRNISVPADGTSGSQTGHYEILPAKYSGGNKLFYYVEMTCEKSVVTSGATYACNAHYYLIPDSTSRLYDPTQESAFKSYSDKNTSFKAWNDSGKIIGIEIEENKDINGYKLDNGILWYPNVLDFFPDRSNE
jgi:hypothetical protein